MFTGLLIFYGIALTIILVGGLLTFVLFRRKGLLLAYVSSLCIMSILVLIWPLPIHGDSCFLAKLFTMNGTVIKSEKFNRILPKKTGLHRQPEQSVPGRVTHSIPGATFKKMDERQLRFRSTRLDGYQEWTDLERLAIVAFDQFLAFVADWKIALF